MIGDKLEADIQGTETAGRNDLWADAGIQCEKGRFILCIGHLLGHPIIHRIIHPVILWLNNHFHDITRLY